MKTTIKLLAVAMMALAMVACTPSNSPKGVMNNYMSLTQKGDYEKALDLFYFRNALSDEDKAQLAALLKDKATKDNEKKGGIKSSEVTAVELAEDGLSAQVSYVIRYGDGSEKADVQKVVKVDGKWLLDAGK